MFAQQNIEYDFFRDAEEDGLSDTKTTALRRFLRNREPFVHRAATLHQDRGVTVKED